MKRLNIPISEETIRELRVGDEVELYGVIMTARDAAHKYMISEPADEVRSILEGGVIYHCGPVVRKDDAGNYSFVAAGPTTSIREEPYQAPIIKKYGVRAVIGKGGMREKTIEGLKEYGAVYLHAIGGMGTLLAESVKKVRTVYKLEEFGVPEAMWVIEVEGFPAVVTMDSTGKSIHAEILEKSSAAAQKLIHG